MSVGVLVFGWLGSHTGIDVALPAGRRSCARLASLWTLALSHPCAISVAKLAGNAHLVSRQRRSSSGGMTTRPTRSRESPRLRCRHWAMVPIEMFGLLRAYLRCSLLGKRRARRCLTPTGAGDAVDETAGCGSVIENRTSAAHRPATANRRSP